jgi:hypothetical protein
MCKSVQNTLDPPSTLLSFRKGVGMTKTILVADDNPSIRKALCEIFKAEGDYELCAEAKMVRMLSI